jgi:CheY-like chemotaxis protein
MFRTLLGRHDTGADPSGSLGDHVDAARPYILVIDDLADSADSLAELLTLWGYDAEPCYSGSTALEAARTRCPDAVLLDLGMPRMTGLQFALRFRDLPGCEAAPIIAVTGHHTLPLQAREMGIDHYLLKPADLGFLQELLGRLTATTEPLHRPAGLRRPRTERRLERCVTA